MYKVMLECINKTFIFKQIFDLLARAAASIWGWVFAAGAFFCNMIAPEWYCFAVVLTAIILDAFFGILVAIKRKKFALSKLGRVTSFKITSYGACLVIVFLIEKIAHDTGFIGIKIAAAWAAACEFWSMSASILIIWPEAHFFRIMRKQLKGEIAAKLGKPIDDILPEDEEAAQ